MTAAQAAEILILATVIILPFTLQFDTSNMVQGIALAQHHSLPHQLLVLWGLPGILTILFVVSLLVEKLRGAEQKSLYHRSGCRIFSQYLWDFARLGLS